MSSIERPRTRSLARIGLLVATLAVTSVSFLPLRYNGFVNWDDPDTIVLNPQLSQPGVLAWAFTTTHMGHYQPLSWIIWSAVARIGGGAPAYHSVSLAFHLANTALVFLLAIGLTRPAALSNRAQVGMAGVAAILFGAHPLRVEPVAWASAFPYLLAFGPLALSLVAYLKAASSSGAAATRWMALSLGAFAASLLARPVALGFPLVLLAVDFYPLGRVQHGLGRAIGRAIPFAVFALTAAVAEAAARPLASLEEVPAGARLTMAVQAPFVYLGRTLVPVRLSPLDPLPLAPHVSWEKLILCTAGLIVITIACIAARQRWPALLVGWIAYVALLAPALGLTPSGLQASADRYSYMPGAVVSVIAAATIVHLLIRSGSRAPVVIATGAMVIGLVVATWQQTRWWHDSITLWTRVADLDPANDIALYNLGIALAEAGREDEAIARYEQTLRLIPDHGPASHNLRLLEATRYQKQGDRLATAGRLAEAIDAYGEAIERDPARARVRANRGAAELELGRVQAAADDLRAAWSAGVRNPATANALAFALIQRGSERDAAVVLREAFASHPDDSNLGHNLARLLATASDPAIRDGQMALRLAQQVVQSTESRDPRALDTLAAAYAEVGDFDRAQAVSRQAAATARMAGDRELANVIQAHGRLYRKKD